jgi:hypothetical protein
MNGIPSALRLSVLRLAVLRLAVMGRQREAGAA